ncbi:hypothetical protein D3C72_1922870 [compost metagenome]
MTSGAHSPVTCDQAKVSARLVTTLLNRGLLALTPSAILLQFIRSVDLAAARWEPNT